MNTSYKAEIKAYGESSYNSNALRFGSFQEAEAYARELLSRWFGAELYRIAESEDQVNYIFNYGTGKAQSIS